VDHALTLSSIFRDSTHYIDRYFSQIAALEEVVGPIRLVIAEGDSEDGTYEALKGQIMDRISLGFRDDTLIQVNHGGPKFGSVDNPLRWNQIAQVCNAVMDCLPHDKTPKVYIESDLIWNPKVIVQLVEDLAEVEAVAPMSMMADGLTTRFYDLWGHRGLDGERFSMDPPYHMDLARTYDPLVEISSAGSCVAMRSDIARVARFGDNDCIVGLGRSIRYECRGHLYLDRRVAVRHP
jgi:hypothetical protein